MSLVFLHLSDIHFRKGESGSLFDLDADLRNELERDALEVLGTATIDGILVSGDVAFGGMGDEYTTADAWITRLCGLLRIAEDKVYVVPGNHDVDREVARRSKIVKLVQAELRAAPPADLDSTIRALFEDDGAAQALFSPLENYNKFATPFECSVGPEQPWWDADFTLDDGSTFRLRGITSVFVSDESDNDLTNKMVIGSLQVSLTRQDGVCWGIMCHHPPDWLKDADSFEQLLAPRSHLQLFGHKHNLRVARTENFVRVSAGATHPSRREPNWRPTYNVITLQAEGEKDFRKLRVKIVSRIWNLERQAFTLDAGADYGQREYLLDLPFWEGPTKTEPIQGPVQALDGKSESEGQEGFVPSKRLLTYRFLKLPYNVRLRIAQDLSLIQDSDEGLPQAELYKRWFERARDKEIVEAFWSAIVSSETNTPPVTEQNRHDIE